VNQLKHAVCMQLISAHSTGYQVAVEYSSVSVPYCFTRWMTDVTGCYKWNSLSHADLESAQYRKNCLSQT